MDDSPNDRRREDFKAAIEAYAKTPAGQAKAERYRDLRQRILDQDARSADTGRAIARLHEREAAVRTAARKLEEDRHRELVAALKEGSAHSWRRDIIVAAIGAFFGLIAGLIVAYVT